MIAVEGEKEREGVVVQPKDTRKANNTNNDKHLMKGLKN